MSGIEPTAEFRAARTAARSARGARPGTVVRPSQQTAQAVLDQLPYADAARWRAAARDRLPGALQADNHSVTVLAAELYLGAPDPAKGQ